MKSRLTFHIKLVSLKKLITIKFGVYPNMGIWLLAYKYNSVIFLFNRDEI